MSSSAAPGLWISPTNDSSTPILIQCLFVCVHVQVQGTKPQEKEVALPGCFSACVVVVATLDFFCSRINSSNSQSTLDE